MPYDGKPMPSVLHLRTLVPALSAAVALFLGAVYWWRPDWATALTIFPAWGWLVGWLPALRWPRSRGFLVATALWLGFGLAHVEEYRSLLRMLRPAPGAGETLKVATLNCSGSGAAFRDAMSGAPDVLLLQESPSERDIRELLEGRPRYDYVYGIDTSIVARGSLESASESPIHEAAVATIDGRRYFVLSLHLTPSEPRIDLWNPRCWASQRALRERQVGEMESVRAALPSAPPPLVVGGDFNVLAGDRVFDLIEDQVDDTFRQGGRGWCNTILRGLPVHRIDQVWISPGLTCPEARARDCPDTDHRLYWARVARK